MSGMGLPSSFTYGEVRLVSLLDGPGTYANQFNISLIAAYSSGAKYMQFASYYVSAVSTHVPFRLTLFMFNGDSVPITMRRFLSSTARLLTIPEV